MIYSQVGGGPDRRSPASVRASGLRELAERQVPSGSRATRCPVLLPALGQEDPVTGLGPQSARLGVDRTPSGRVALGDQSGLQGDGAGGEAGGAGLGLGDGLGHGLKVTHGWGLCNPWVRAPGADVLPGAAPGARARAGADAPARP